MSKVEMNIQIQVQCNLFMLRGAQFFKALGIGGNRGNPEAGRAESCHRPSTCRWPPTWTPPHPSLAACRGWRPSTASSRLRVSLGNTEEFRASNSAEICISKSSKR